MDTIGKRYIAKIKAGQADFENRDDQSRVHHDGSIYYYDTTGMNLETFRIAVAVAFDADPEVMEWGASNIYRADVY